MRLIACVQTSVRWSNQIFWGVLGIAVISLVGCSDDVEWHMGLRRDMPAPDGKHIAVVFELTSGNTTGCFPQLSLLRPGEKLGLHGNLVQGGLEERIETEWLSSTELTVRYSSALPGRSVTNVDGLTITITPF